MNKDYAWRSAGLMLVLCMVALGLLASCGSNGGGAAGDGLQVSDTTGGATEGTALTITEDEIGSLPAWQQELLADAGWNQPPIPQRPDTPMPAPSYEMLLEWQAQAVANPGQLAPRGAEDGKGSSWTAGKQPVNISINRGEYNIPFTPSGTVPYGCKDSTGTGDPIHMKEKKLAAEPIPTEANQAISYVEKGVAGSNHFTGAGGSSNNALCAVYQLWSSLRAGDPTLPYSSYSPPSSAPKFAEVSYRADGGPGAGGNPCNAVAAYTVKDFIWWKYNSTINALPGGNSTALYNILIAPSSNVEPVGESPAPNKTKGRIQYFYCGNLSSTFGGGAIVTLESSESSCTTFKDSIANNRLFYTNPIYGVMLKRWQDSVLASMNAPDNKPWDGEFGWPVQGPVAYNNGAATLTGNGAYYAWGIYFERGFMWWIDYINNANVPDEAQAYSYTGANVFCKGQTDRYDKLPTIFYGGSGPLGVSVVVEASLNPSRGPGSPPAGSFYEVGNPAPPGPALVLDMHAHGYGGTPRASDGRYKYYTWAFRDGTIGVTNGAAYDDTTKYLTHSYSVQSIYTIRVQVVDSLDNIGYGDSLPIHVGSGGGGATAGQVWLIRMDGGTYNANYNAIKASLSAIGVSFSEKTMNTSTATDFNADAVSKVAILYRGGPGAAGENPNTTPWTSNDYTQLNSLLSTGTKKKVLLFSQSHGTTNSLTFPFSDPSLWVAAYSSSLSTATADYTQLGPIEGGNSTSSNYQYQFPPGFMAGWHQPQSFTAGMAYTMRFGSSSANAAERYAGAGSSGKVPISFSVAGNRQLTTRFRPGLTFSGWSPGFLTGIIAGMPSTQDSYSMLSYGCTQAPGMSGGTGKYWCIGYSWNDMSVTGGTANKNDTLRNILAWFDSSITFTANTNQGFQEYAGPPEILSVTPAYWQNQAYVTGGQTPPWNGAGGQYPDQTGSDVYRTSGGLPGAVLTTDPNNNWINGNDVDFQHPLYAYINGGGTGVEIGPGSIGTTDDTVFYAGLLLSDADNSWDRFTPAGTPSIQLKEEQNNTMSRKPVPVTAGYYQTTGAGGTGDDVYASYGTQIDAFTAAAQSWNNNDPLHVECLAHWPQTLKYFNWSGPGGQAPNAPDAYLVWQVYPGQGIRVPSGPEVGKFIGLNATWNEYLRTMDIDTASGWNPAGRTGDAWNRPSFSFRNDPLQGRAIDFNFRKLKDWNGDLNRDGTINNSDKFPVRVRLFTNHQAYWNKVVSPSAAGWPNHLANPGADPATTPPASRAETFLEAGTYVRDHGTPVYTLQVVDDPAQPDPGAPGTITGQGPGSYQVTLSFIMKYGSPNYHVDVDTWYTGSFGPNNGVNPVSYSPDFTSEGPKTITINVPPAQQNGNYTFAIRVTDQDTPASSVTYVWPNQVGLFPQAVFIENFDNDTTLANWTLSGDNIGYGDGEPSSGWEWRSVTGALFSWDYWGWGDELLNPHSGSRFAFFGTGSTTTGYPYYYPDWVNRTMTTTSSYPCNNGQSYTITFRTIGAAEGYWDGLVPEISFNNGATWINNSTFLSGLTYTYGAGVGKYGYNGNSPSGWTNTWTQRSGTVTATGTQFKLRFTFTSDSSWQCSSMGVDSITVQ